MDLSVCQRKSILNAYALRGYVQFSWLVGVCLSMFISLKNINSFYYQFSSRLTGYEIQS